MKQIGRPEIKKHGVMHRAQSVKKLYLFANKIAFTFYCDTVREIIYHFRIIFFPVNDCNLTKPIIKK